MATGVKPIPKHIRLVTVVLASALFLLAVMNLVLISEQAASVEPEKRAAREWRAGLDALQGRESWTFKVMTNGRSIVDLDVDFPYTISKTHVRGDAELKTRMTYHMDGILLAQEERSFYLTTPPNSTGTTSRTTSERGAFGFHDNPLMVDIPNGLESFVLLITWDWTLTASSGAELSFRVQAGEVTIDPLDSGGIAACDNQRCSRLFVVFALLAQVLAFVWLSAAPSPDGSTPWQRRQARVEKPLQDFEVDDPTALPTRTPASQKPSPRQKA